MTATNLPGTGVPAPSGGPDMPNVGSANAPGANAPGANAPGANAPGANAPGANAPGANAPGGGKRAAGDTAGTESAGNGEALGSAVRRGLGWSLVSSVLTRAGTVLSGIILARLLAPEDYGQFTVALVVLLLVANINDLGLEATLVRWPTAIDKIAPTATTIIGGVSMLLFGVVFLGAHAIASSMNAPEATGIVRLLAVSVAVNGLFAVPSAVLTREFMQRQRTIADLTGVVVTLGLSIVLALMGYGAWSLAWGRLIGNAVNSVLLWVFVPVRYRPGWSAPAARIILRSGMPIAGTLLLAVALMNVDYVVVGRILGPIEVGLYLMAFNLSSWPVSLLSVAVARVSVAGFARLQTDTAALRAAFRRSLTLVMTPTVLVCVLLSAYALPATRVVYGAQWAPAAAALSFLALLGGLRVAMQLAADLLTALDRGRLTFAIQGVWLAVLIPVMALGVWWHGIEGAGIAHLVVALAVAIPAYLVALTRLRIMPGDVFGPMLLPVLAGLAAAAVAFVAFRVLHGDLLVLLLGGALSALAFAAMSWPVLRLLRGPVSTPRHRRSRRGPQLARPR